MDGFGEVLPGRVNVNEQYCLPVICEKREIWPQRLVILRQRPLQSRGKLRSLDKLRLLMLQGGRQIPAHPSVMESRVAGLFVLPRRISGA